MRYVYIALLVIFAAVILVFSYQNRTTATVSFLSWSTTLPQFVFVIGAYLLGMASGGSVAGFLRHSVHGATEQPGLAAGGRGQQANWHGLRPSLLSSALTVLLAALAAAVVQVEWRRLAHLIQAIPHLRQRRRTELLTLTDALRWIVDVLIV